MRRVFVGLRVSDVALGEVRDVAGESFDGNVSSALRMLLLLGLVVWKSGVRDPQVVAKRLG